ncbi:MAG TPA: DUF3168 domain-containing protein [Tepidisphaeraceae bacterium]|nr:DUF3168 domain-containing protein [Tepidisphaeraceae bacterium]
MIENALRLLLIRTDAVHEVIGDRAYFVGTRPQNERRASIVLTRIATTHGRTFGAGITHTTGRVQLDCLAGSYQQARELATLARQTIDGYTTDLDAMDPRYFPTLEIRQTVPIQVHYVEVEDERDIETTPLEGKAEPLFGVSVDATFLYESN